MYDYRLTWLTRVSLLAAREREAGDFPGRLDVLGRHDQLPGVRHLRHVMRVGACDYADRPGEYFGSSAQALGLALEIAVVLTDSHLECFGEYHAINLYT